MIWVAVIVLMICLTIMDTNDKKYGKKDSNK